MEVTILVAHELENSKIELNGLLFGIDGDELGVAEWTTIKPIIRGVCNDTGQVGLNSFFQREVEVGFSVCVDH